MRILHDGDSGIGRLRGEVAEAIRTGAAHNATRTEMDAVTCEGTADDLRVANGGWLVDDDGNTTWIAAQGGGGK